MSKRREKIRIILILGDFALMQFSIFFALLIRYQSFSFIRDGILTNHIVYMIILHVLWLVFLYLLDFYVFPPIYDYLTLISHLLIFIILCFVSGGIYFYLLPSSRIAPKTILIIDALLLAIFITIFRFFLQKWAEKRQVYENVLMICSTEELSEIDDEHLKKHHINVAYQIGISDFEEASFSGDVINKLRPDIVVLGQEIYSGKERKGNTFERFPLGYKYMSFLEFYTFLYKKIPLDFINDYWILEKISHKPNTNTILKRLFDISISIIALIATLPLWPVLIILIKITSQGPAIYKQKRVGLKNRTFNIYKFRTMYKNAEDNGPQWSKTNDARITPIGRLLRKTHLDEIPQLINILKGELSFVGPRPERPEFVEILKREVPYFELRHMARPGITGWAQINYGYANSIADSREKLQYDLYYIANMSIVFDFSIILKTFKLIFYS